MSPAESRPVPRPLEIAPPEASRILIGHEAAERTLLDGYRSGRLPHAWLIDGPAGIGKATLAYRFARFLLAHPDPAGADMQAAADLGVADDSAVTRQIAARAHPNLVVLQRPRDEDGKTTGTSIPIDEIRRAGRFLATTAAGGGWRIVIVDAADDLLRPAANALLKMLEEPPTRSLFLLVAHMPGRLLPTVRSRCRRLPLKPLPEATVAEMLHAAGEGEDPADLALAARLAQGSFGRALEIVSPEGRNTAHAVSEVLEQMPRLDAERLRALGERLGRRGGEAGFRLAGTMLLDWIAARTRQAARRGAVPGQLAPWSEVWEKVSRALAETEVFNLDRTQTLLMAFRSVSAAAVQDARA